MTNHIGLIILDGWGIGDQTESDAIFHAKTPVMDALLANYPAATLKTSGEDVGLPDGQMGNSEVGHLNIGAGRIVYQELTRINKAIRERTFFSNPALIQAMQHAKDKGVALHLMGLVSKGGVHSSQEHLYALCEMAKEMGLQKVFIHAFTDGRDCDPKSGLGFVQELEARLVDSPAKIATVVGRYYAMDRDLRWERVQQAYHVMVNSKGQPFTSASEAIESSYADGITDEFLAPVVIVENGEAIARIQDEDVLISFNFRTDRPREIIRCLTQEDFPAFEMKKLAVELFTMTNYDATFTNVHVIYDKDNLQNTLGEVLAKLDRTQVRIAETEKYPHVTFFFSGGREEVFAGEERLLIQSPKVATYDLQPSMSAPEITEKICQNITTNHPNFFCLNFANPDMVGHTGVYSAIVEAVETVDVCLGKIIEVGKKNGYEFIVIADHGNADYAMNPDGSPNTAHSLNPVPIVLVTDEELTLTNGILADVAPTILGRLGLASPIEMTGENLVVRQIRKT